MARTNIHSSMYVPIKGTTTNDSAAAGFVGEVVSSAATATDCAATGAYKDLNTLSVSAGDWLVYAYCEAIRNGATMTGWRMGVSTTTGNDATGLTLGDTVTLTNMTFDNTTCTMPAVHIQLAAAGSVYQKIRADYSAATPQARGRITAVRIR